MPIAKLSEVTATKVLPNSTAAINAAASPPARAGRAMPAACTTSAVSTSVDRDQRRARPAHIAADGAAARPVITQAPLPSQAGPARPTAATRKVPAMM